MIEQKNTLFLQIKYASLISGQLQKHKVKKQTPYTSNFKCPLCEANTATRKTRGYIFQKKTDLFFFCHNCGTSTNFINFLKGFAPELHSQFWFEVYQSEGKPTEELPAPVVKPNFLSDKSPLKALKKVSQLPYDHAVKQYVVNRKIPNFYHSQLFFAPKFVEWVNSIIPGKLDSKDHPRLIIPMFDEKKQMFGFQGRAFSDKQIKYITILLDEDRQKVFGLDRVDFEKPVRILEGPIDSMFLENGLANCSADLDACLRLLPDGTKYVLIPDRDRRNKQIVDRIEKWQEEGHPVCLLPQNLSGKDLNEMVQNGTSIEQLNSIIEDNTFQGLRLKLELSFWKKVR